MLKLLVRIILVLLIADISPQLKGQNRNLEYHYQNGIKACDEEKYQACLEHFTAANKLHSGHQIIMYHLARALAFNSKIDSSAYYLQKALAIKGDLDLSDSAFIELDKASRLTEFYEFQNQLMAPVNQSETVIQLNDRTLHLESIAFDPKTNRLLLGSVHKQKILEVDLTNNKVTDFIGTGDHGIWSVFGMKVDTARRNLWVCTVATKLMAHADSTIEETSAVYKFDLDSKNLIKTFTLNDSTKHWFGDLTISSNGEVYISDSRANSIYKIGDENEGLGLFYHNPDFISLQGLDLSSDNRFLFLADYVKGPYRLELNSKNILKLSSKLRLVSLKSIDGLYFHDNSLVATQNSVVPMRVTIYHLNPSMDAITDYRYLEKANPLLNEPTLGTIVDNWFYYVANSQWGGYDKHNRPLPYQQLQDIHILKVRID